MVHSSYSRKTFCNRLLKALFVAILPLIALSTQAQNLSRLFTTPELRHELDAVRNNPPSAAPERAEIHIDIPEPPKPPKYISFNGIVRRSDGMTTVWVNDSTKLVRKEFLIALDKMSDKKILPVELSGSHQILQLRPGQSIDTASGHIMESLPPPDPKK